MARHHTESNISQCRIQSYFGAGIPVWDPRFRPQILKNVRLVLYLFNVKHCLSSQTAMKTMFWASQNAKQPQFLRALPLDPTGEGLQHPPSPPDPPAAMRFLNTALLVYYWQEIFPFGSDARQWSHPLMVPLHSLWAKSNNRTRGQFECDVTLFLFWFRSFTCTVLLLFHNMLKGSGGRGRLIWNWTSRVKGVEKCRA